MATQAELRAAMECLKGKLENLMELMQTALHTEPFPNLSLRWKLGKAETIWNEIEGLYDHLCTMTEENQAELDRVAFFDFQGRYTELHGRVEDTLEKERSEEEARDQARASRQREQQHQAGWKAIHHRIEEVLKELETSLGGDPIATLDEIDVEEEMLRQVDGLLEVSAGLVDDIINQDSEQTVMMKDAEAAKVVQATSRFEPVRSTLQGSEQRSTPATRGTRRQPRPPPSKHQLYQ